MNSNLPSIYNQSYSELALFLAKHKHSDAKLSRLMGEIYRKLKIDLSHIPEFSSALKKMLHDCFTWELPEIKQTQHSNDGTIKFLIQFADGHCVESVLLNFHKKHTLCISSQVGCAMACSFCFTGKQGYKRNLSAEEILGQYLRVQKWIFETNHSKLPIKNIVFMGQGEPLHNIENVSRAIAIFTEPYGLGLSTKNITVSTSGYIPGLRSFDKLQGANLALSLHSTIDEIRSKLIPINKNYPLSELFNILDKIPLQKKQLIEYEFLLIKGLNNTKEEILGLTKLLSNRPHMINIIPFNPFPNSCYERPTDAEVQFFARGLIENGLRVSIRKTKGTDVLAACGQLNTKEPNKH